MKNAFHELVSSLGDGATNRHHTCPVDAVRFGTDSVSQLNSQNKNWWFAESTEFL